MSRPKKILHQPFLDLLARAGIIPEAIKCNIHRVVIDCTVGEPVRIYFDQFADERLSSLGPKPLARALKTDD